MFTIHVGTVNDLRVALLPMASLCDAADINCTKQRLSIIVLPSRYPFVASLRMFPAFFTSFQFHPDADNLNDYRANFYLKHFTINIPNMYSHDISVTIYLNKHLAFVPIKFEDPHTGCWEYSAMLLAHPHKVDISPIDFRVFVAIHSDEFINLVFDLDVLPNESVSVAVRKTEARFKSQSGEVIFTIENKDCIIGGVPEGAIFNFTICLSPMYFFYHIAYAAEFVWIFKTVSSRSMLSCCMGLYACYVVGF